MAQHQEEVSATATGIAGGRLELILGPMFSGKTTELLRRVRRHALAHRRCLVVKHAADDRYDAGDQCCKVQTHDGVCYSAARAYRLADVQELEGFDSFDVVAIDEGQFFSDVVVMADRFAQLGKVTIVAACDATYTRVPFGYVTDLVARAERVDKLNAVCASCGCDDAAFTQRIGKETQEMLVGGADKYRAACRRCFYAAV